MKKFKKLVAVMLAAIMVMAMGIVNVSASGYDISITNASGKEGHTYIAYQIFAGDYSSGVLSNITWGDNFGTNKVSDLVDALKAENAFNNAFDSLNASSTTLAADIADILSGKADDGEFAQAFAAIIGDYITGTGFSSSDNGSGSYTITVDEVGYYLIVDSTTASISGYDAYSRYMLQVVESTGLTTKEEVPTIDKAVKTDGGSGSYGSYNTAKVGDTIDFQLTITVPQDLTDYDTYKLVITDTLSGGLTIDEDSIEIKINSGSASTVDDDNTNNIYYAYASQELTVYIKNLLSETDYDSTTATTIVVTYQAELNENAVMGNDGNENNASLNYSNNPYGTSEGTTTTKTTKTYTTSLTVTKVDGTLNYTTDLNGAEFTLYNSSGSVVGTATVDGINQGVLSFEGLTEGTYTLIETNTPSGYNTASNITFTLTYTNGRGWEETTGSLSAGTVSGTFKTTIQNKSGATIPNTGGMGTTILYIIGAILVIGAAVILVTRRRMANK